MPTPTARWISKIRLVAALVGIRAVSCELRHVLAFGLSSASRRVQVDLYLPSSHHEKAQKPIAATRRVVTACGSTRTLPLYGNHRRPAPRGTRARASESTCATTRMRRRLLRSISINPILETAVRLPAGPLWFGANQSLPSCCRKHAPGSPPTIVWPSGAVRFADSPTKLVHCRVGGAINGAIGKAAR